MLCLGIRSFFFEIGHSEVVECIDDDEEDIEDASVECSLKTCQ